MTRPGQTWTVQTAARWWLIADDLLTDSALAGAVVDACQRQLLDHWHQHGGLDVGLRISSMVTEQDPASVDYQPRCRLLLIELRGIGYQDPRPAPLVYDPPTFDGCPPPQPWWRRLLRRHA